MFESTGIMKMLVMHQSLKAVLDAVIGHGQPGQQMMTTKTKEVSNGISTMTRFEMTTESCTKR